MAYTEISDIFYGKSAERYKQIQAQLDNKTSFAVPHYLTFSPESYDDITVAKIAGQDHCFIKYTDYQFYVTENTIVETCKVEGKESFVQRVCDPETQTETAYYISPSDENVVEIRVDQEVVLENGKTQKCGFSINLQPNQDFWQNIKLGAMSVEELIDFCVKNSSDNLDLGLMSTFSVGAGSETIDLSEDKYSHHATHASFNPENPNATNSSTKSGSLAEQIEWFEKFHKEKFINPKNIAIYELFKKLEPRLRKVSKEKESKHNWGNNLDKLMKSYNVDNSKKVGY